MKSKSRARVWTLGLLGLGLVMILPIFSSAQNEDQPDQSFENKWFEINQRETFKPIGRNAWKASVGERESEEYQVQPGDTLWGLSKTFFGNGYFWPKLWQVNSKFENPHEISPGQTIHFVSGGGDAPEVRVGDADEVDSSLQASDDDVIQTDDGEIDIPPQSPAHEVLRELPKSLPNILLFFTNGNVSAAGIYLEKEIPVRKDIDVPVRFFAMKNEPVSIGVVSAIEGGEISGPWKGTVYFKLQASTRGTQALTSISPGTNLRTYRRGDLLKDPLNEKILGREFDYSSDIQVIGETNESGIYSAKVNFSLDEIKEGDQISVGKIPHYRLIRKKALTEIPGMVIGNPYRQEGKGEGLSNYIFINLGAASGLKPNDHIPIFGVTAKLKNGHEIFAKRGEAIVMSVSENLASAYVYKSNTLIRVGDLVGQNVVSEVKASSTDRDDLMKE